MHRSGKQLLFWVIVLASNAKEEVRAHKENQEKWSLTSTPKYYSGVMQGMGSKPREEKQLLSG